MSKKPNKVDQRDSDPLLIALELVCKQHDLPFSRKTATKGFNLVTGQLTPRTIAPVARRLGLDAEVQRLHPRLLKHAPVPCIMILEDNQAYLLSESPYSDDVAVCLYDEDGEIRYRELDDYTDNYAGYVITLEQRSEVEPRTTQFTIDYIMRSWFFQTISRGVRYLPHLVLASVLLNLFVFYVPIFTMNVYDRVIPYNAINTLWTLVIGVGIFLIFDFIIGNMRSIIMTFASVRMNDIMSNQLFEHILRLKVDQKPMTAAGFVENTKEFSALREFVTSATLITIIDLPFILLFVGGVIYLAGSLVLVPLIGLAIILTTNLLVQPLASRLTVNAARRDTQKQALQIEAIMSLETIKSLCAETIFMQRYKALDDLTPRSEPNKVMMTFFNSFTLWMQKIISVAVVAYGATMVADAKITVGQLVAASILSARVMAVGQIGALLFRMNRAKSAIEKINKFMALPTDAEQNKEAMITNPLEGKIEFDNVTFYYPGDRQPALSDINLSIKPGERIGIIGRSGAGKSTLLRMMVGLHTPTTGNVLIDNIDAQEIAPLSLRHYLHYCAVNARLFYGSVRDNVMLANQHADDERFMQAVQIAGVDQFTNKHPKGLNLMIGEHGGGLSAGQSQAVTLARAMVSEANVLLFDEPTANIDNVSGKEFMRRMTDNLGDRTLILVSHRASMVEYVDRLIVLHEGKIIADGPRKKVLEKMSKSSL